MSTPPPRPELAPWHALALCALAVLVGGALRAHGLGTDFWLDEVWTWSRARELSSAAGVFTSLHDSNNHHLNTLWFYAIGEAPAWLYRLPAWLAGTATIGLGAALAWRRGRLEAVLAAWLLALCFALVHFSSEARGYAPVVCFALAAQLVLEADLAAPRLRRAAWFGALVVLGFLSQLVFLFYWSGAVAQSLWRWRALPPARLALRLASRHALPLAALGALYALDLHALHVGGGNPTDLARLAAETVGWTVGLPVRPSLALPDVALALALVGAGLALRARRGDDSWIGLLFTIVLAPLAVFAWLRPEVIAFRYFLIGCAFALLLGADLTAAAWRAGGARGALALCALAVFLIGNGAHLQAFARYGRGGYRAALQTMAAHTPGPEIEVGSDHDFRNGLVLSYYARELPAGKRLHYLTREHWPPGGPTWLIRHAARRPSRPAQMFRADGSRYRLFAEFDHAAISGFYWALYRKEEPAAGSSEGGASRE